MNGRFILDTNIIIALFAKDPAIHDCIANAAEVFVPSIAIGELYFGAYKSQKIQENIRRIDDLYSIIQYLHVIQILPEDMVS